MLRGDITLILARTFARPIPRGFGLLGGVEKLDILRFRQACQAARAAVDARGFYRIDKLSVRLRIPCEHGGPAWIMFGIKRRRKRFHDE
ncbi:hypothetical protein D3C81_1772000 [compost metagenome]